MAKQASRQVGETSPRFAEANQNVVQTSRTLGEINAGLAESSPEVVEASQLRPNATQCG